MLPISIGLLCASFTWIPTAPAGDHPVTRQDTRIIYTVSPSRLEAEQVYQAIGLDKYGLSAEAFQYAWTGYQHLNEQQLLGSGRYLTICDLSQSSKNKRLYIIDLENNQLVKNTFVAHGKNSGDEYARRFSNTPESLQSSLGFFITSKTYIGKHGLSLRLTGTEPGINDKAYERTIVIHGADYVNAGRVKAGMYMGRSWGCPAVPKEESAAIIHMIKNGSCLFIYYPSGTYLKKSKILNG